MGGPPNGTIAGNSDDHNSDAGNASTQNNTFDTADNKASANYAPIRHTRGNRKAKTTKGKKAPFNPYSRVSSSPRDHAQVMENFTPTSYKEITARLNRNPRDRTGMGEVVDDGKAYITNTPGHRKFEFVSVTDIKTPNGTVRHATLYEYKNVQPIVTDNLADKEKIRKQAGKAKKALCFHQIPNPEKIPEVPAVSTVTKRITAQTINEASGKKHISNKQVMNYLSANQLAVFCGIVKHNLSVILKYDPKSYFALMEDQVKFYGLMQCPRRFMEWCHMIAKMFGGPKGGPQIKENLRGGSFECNSRMLVEEMVLHDLLKYNIVPYIDLQVTNYALENLGIENQEELKKLKYLPFAKKIEYCAKFPNGTAVTSYYDGLTSRRPHVAERTYLLESIARYIGISSDDDKNTVYDNEAFQTVSKMRL